MCLSTGLHSPGRRLGAERISRRAVGDPVSERPVCGHPQHFCRRPLLAAKSRPRLILSDHLGAAPPRSKGNTVSLTTVTGRASTPRDSGSTSGSPLPRSPSGRRRTPPAATRTGTRLRVVYRPGRLRVDARGTGFAHLLPLVGLALAALSAAGVGVTLPRASDVSDQPRRLESHATLSVTVAATTSRN